MFVLYSKIYCFAWFIIFLSCFIMCFRVSLFSWFFYVVQCLWNCCHNSQLKKKLTTTKTMSTKNAFATVIAFSIFYFVVGCFYGCYKIVWKIITALINKNCNTEIISVKLHCNWLPALVNYSDNFITCTRAKK